MDWTPDDRDKALAVVLNKVDGLWCAYYAVDLASSHDPLPEADARAVLAAVDTESDGFHWRGATRSAWHSFPSSCKSSTITPSFHSKRSVASST